MLLVSMAFYGWALPDGMLYISIYIILVYLMGKIISGQGCQKSKWRAVAISILVLIGILFFCKYYNFVLENLNRVFGTGFDAFYMVVPLGISFITFSAISYVVDVFRGSAEAGNILDVALYMLFFPKVISGPIVLWKDFQSQIRLRIVNDVRFVDGLNRMIIGYAKKVILADTFGKVIYDIQRLQESGVDLPTAWGYALLYMLEIYYDFSGYSDIALGLAKLLGFQFQENFHFPYISASITEFWRRWHISLGTWFREYLYIPLGGNRKGQYRTLLNLFVVFLVTGIWHGAGWNYLAWGALNGICVVIERGLRDKEFYRKIPYFVKWAVTMFIVLISWEIFHLPGLRSALSFLKILFGLTTFETYNFTYAFYFTPKIILLAVIGIYGATALHKKWFLHLAEKMRQSRVLFILQEGFLLALMVLAVMFMVNSTYSPFIYFQY